MKITTTTKLTINAALLAAEMVYLSTAVDAANATERALNPMSLPEIIIVVKSMLRRANPRVSPSTNSTSATRVMTSTSATSLGSQFKGINFYCLLLYSTFFHHSHFFFKDVKLEITYYKIYNKIVEKF